MTTDGKPHSIESRWDLVIAHPPCTYLSNAGAKHLYKTKGVLNKDRFILGLKGKLFFMTFWLYGWFGVGKICIENPIPSRIYELPEKTQVVQPYEFGHPYSKKTYLWLFGVPPLMPSNIIDKENVTPYITSGSYTKNHDPKYRGFSRKGGSSRSRSKTFTGIAQAMAEQWGGVVDG